MRYRFFVKVTLLYIILTPTPVWEINPALAQSRAKVETATNCETNILYIDEALAQIDLNAYKESPIIAIARLGDGETSRIWNERRLFNLRMYVREFKKSDVQLILAEGERVRGLGRIEILVGCKLFRTLLVRPNKDLPVGTCTDDKRNCVFYPWRNNSRIHPCWPG